MRSQLGSTDTIYVVNTGDDTVSVINGASCNGRVTSGCRRKPAQVRVGRQDFGFAVIDQGTNKIYVSNYLDDAVSVINGATCNGRVTSGCRQIPATVPAGANPAGLAVDAASRTVYAADNGAGTVSFFRFQPPSRPGRATVTVRHNHVVVRWQRIYSGGLPIIYRVIVSPACPRCRSTITPATSGIPVTVIFGLHPGRRYTFRIEAIDAAGVGRISARSNPVIYR